MQEMPSKRKQYRKIKRNIKRKVQQHRAAEQQKEDQQQQLLKLMAMLSAGRPASGGSSMDTATFLQSRENDALRKNKELKAEKRRQKEEAERRKTEEQNTMLQQQIVEGDKRLQMEAEKRGLKLQLAEINKKIGENAAGTSLDDLQRQINKLADDIAQAMLSLDFHNKPDSKLRTHYQRLATDLGKLSGEYLDLEKKLQQHEATVDEIKHLKSIVSRFKKNLADTQALNRKMQLEMKDYENQRMIFEDAQKEYYNLQRETAKTERKLLAAKQTTQASKPLYMIDGAGNLFSDYTHKLRDEVDPSEIEEIDDHYRNYTSIIAHIQKIAGNIKTLHPVLISKKFGKKTTEYKQLEELYNKLPDEQKYVIKRDGRETVISTFNDLADTYITETNLFARKHDEAGRVLREAQSYNESIRAQYPTPVRSGINANEAIAILQNRKEDLEEKLESIGIGRRERKKLQQELITTQANIQKLEAHVNSSPEPGLSPTKIQQYAEARQHEDDLRRSQSRKQAKRDAIDSLEEQGIKTDVKNQFETGVLEKTGESDGDYERRVKDLAEKQAERELQEKKNEVTKMTQKFEEEERLIAAQESVRDSPRYKHAEKQIHYERARLQMEKEEAEQQERYRQAQHEAREALHANQAKQKLQKDMDEGNLTYDNMIAQVGVAVEGMEKLMDQQQRDRNYVKEGRDRILDRLSKNNLLTVAYNDYLRRHGYDIRNYEDVTDKVLQTPENIDEADRTLNMLQQRITKETHGIQQGDKVRFIGETGNPIQRPLFDDPPVYNADVSDHEDD